MTIIQVGLTVSLFLVLVYGLTHREMIRIFRVILMIISVVGIILVWRPDIANIIARSVGVGRGADLILYCWIVLSLLIVLNVQIKLRTLKKDIVLLTRSIAISSAVNSLDDGSSD